MKLLKLSVEIYVFSGTNGRTFFNVNLELWFVKKLQGTVDLSKWF